MPLPGDAGFGYGEALARSLDGRARSSGGNSTAPTLPGPLPPVGVVFSADTTQVAALQSAVPFPPPVVEGLVFPSPSTGDPFAGDKAVFPGGPATTEDLGLNRQSHGQPALSILKELFAAFTVSDDKPAADAAPATIPPEQQASQPPVPFLPNSPALSPGIPPVDVPVALPTLLVEFSNVTSTEADVTPQPPATLRVLFESRSSGDNLESASHNAAAQMPLDWRLMPPPGLFAAEHSAVSAEGAHPAAEEPSKRTRVPVSFPLEVAGAVGSSESEHLVLPPTTPPSHHRTALGEVAVTPMDEKLPTASGLPGELSATQSPVVLEASPPTPPVTTGDSQPTTAVPSPKAYDRLGENVAFAETGNSGDVTDVVTAAQTPAIAGEAGATILPPLSPGNNSRQPSSPPAVSAPSADDPDPSVPLHAGDFEPFVRSKPSISESVKDAPVVSASEQRDQTVGQQQTQTPAGWVPTRASGGPNNPTSQTEGVVFHSSDPAPVAANTETPEAISAVSDAVRQPTLASNRSGSSHAVPQRLPNPTAVRFENTTVEPPPSSGPQDQPPRAHGTASQATGSVTPMGAASSVSSPAATPASDSPLSSSIVSAPAAEPVPIESAPAITNEAAPDEARPTTATIALDSRGDARTVRSSAPAPSSAETTATTADSESAELVHRVSNAMRLAHQQGQSLRARLHPPELGALQIEIFSRDGALTARLEVATAAARQALVENLPQLNEALAQHGTTVERIDVQLQQPAREGPHSRHDEQRGQHARRENSGRQQREHAQPEDERERNGERQSLVDQDFDEMDIAV